jgi:hypothetical protein
MNQNGWMDEWIHFEIPWRTRKHRFPEEEDIYACWEEVIRRT